MHFSKLDRVIFLGQQKIKPGQNSDRRGTENIAQLPDLSSFKCKNMDAFSKLEKVLSDPRTFQKIVSHFFWTSTC